MSRINEKLGLRPAGQRRMMQLPKNLTARNKITSAKCPECHRTGANASKTHPGALYCTWCNTIFQVESES